MSNTTRNKGHQAKQKPRNYKGDRSIQRQIQDDVLNEVKLDAKTPIPFEYGGTYFTSIGGEKVIPFLNGLDNFSSILLEARLLSVSQNACVSTKTNYTVGKGIVIRNLKDGQKAPDAYTNWFKYMNNRRMNGNKILRKVVDTFLTFGNAPIEVVRLEVQGRKFLYVYPRNFIDCKLSWPDENDEVKNVVISKRFRKTGYVGLDNDSVTIPLYKAGPGKKEQYFLKDGKVSRTMLWVKNEVAGYDYYGLPSSVSSLPYQKLEYDSVRFNLDNIENNMVVGGLLVIAGSVSATEANKLATKIVKQHTGSGKRGRVAVYASEEGISDSKYHPFDTHRDGSYIELDGKAQSKIIFANEWDSVLAGLQESSGLGKGAGYLAEVYYQKLQTVIRPIQTVMLEDFWGPLIEIADEWLGTNWAAEFEFDIQPAEIVNNTSELTTTVRGVLAFIQIINTVASGAWPLENAIRYVAKTFGITEQEARDQLGTINVRTQSTEPTGTDKPGGGPSQHT